MELPKLHRDPQQQQHRRSVDKMGSGELSLAGSTKGLEDEWVVSSTPAPMPEATPVQQLKLYQKVLYGMGASYAFNALVVTNGTLIDYYEDTYRLDTSFLSLVNFFTGLVTVFATLGFGFLSDDCARTRYGKRKPFIALLTPLLAFSVAMLYSPRLERNPSYVPAWFAGFSILSQVATSAMMVVIAGWGVGLTREAEDRGGLFLIDAMLDLLGFLTGVYITSANAEKEGGMVLAAIFIIQNALLLRFVPAEPAASGQADHRVPFIPGLHLSMQNRQFVALLKAASFGAIVSTTVNLLPLFFQFVMGVAEADVDEIYALYVKAVVAVAFLTILAVQPLNRHLGRIAVLRLGVVAGMCYGLLALVLSFTSVSSFYLTTVPAGIFAGIVMVNGNVLLCNTIDYDELVTGFRRQSFYQCLILAPVTFVGVAGSSIPLSIISMIGSTDMDSTPSSRVTIVLRLWVTLCVSASLACSYWSLSGFLLTEEVQQEVYLQLQRREAGDVFVPVDPLEVPPLEEEREASRVDLEVLPSSSSSGLQDADRRAADGFLELYFRDSEVVQLLDRDGKRPCLATYGGNVALMALYTVLLLSRTATCIELGQTTRAMLASCLLTVTGLHVIYDACRLPAFLWVYNSTDRDLMKWSRQLVSEKQMLRAVVRSRYGNLLAAVGLHALVITCIALVCFAKVPQKIQPHV